MRLLATRKAKQTTRKANGIIEVTRPKNMMQFEEAEKQKGGQPKRRVTHGSALLTTTTHSKD